MKKLILALIAVAAFWVAPAGAQTHIVVNQANVSASQNAMWTCDRPIAQYGSLPVTVELRFTGPFSNGQQGFGHRIGAGCVGDGNPNTVDLILASNADGVSRGPNEDAIRIMNAGTGFGDLVISGKVNCGPRVVGSTHQDGIQSLGGRNITFFNFEVGNYDAGRATCQGAGGAMFYSGDSLNLDVIGGKYIGCNHALLAGWASGPSEVRNASFRSGYAPGDPKCTESGGYAVSNPCDIRAEWVNAGGQTSNLVCDRYPFEGDPPPPPPPPPPACANGLDDDSDGLVDMADPGCESTLDNDEFNEPPPPPPPGCDQACVDAYEAKIADLEAQVAALEAEVADLEGRLSAALAERDRLGDIIDRAAAVLEEK